MTQTIPVQVPDGWAEILSVYGDPAFNGIFVDPKWEAANMVSVSDFPLVPQKRLYVHRLIVEPLRAALTACAALGDGYRLDTIGSYAPRLQRGSTTRVSMHTFGIAVDLNAARNPLSFVAKDNSLRAQCARDIPDAWVNAFKAQGFVWGGDFYNRFDGMHFQLAKGA